MSDITGALERIESRLDIAILVSQGVPREEAEARVYLPRIERLVTELQTIADRIERSAARLEVTS